MERIQWVAESAHAHGTLMAGVLVLHLSGVVTLNVLRVMRARIRSLAGVAVLLLDFRQAVTTISDHSLEAFVADTGANRQPAAILVGPAQARPFARYCQDIAPRYGATRVLFTDEARAFAWAARQAVVWPAPAPVSPTPSRAQIALR